MSRTKQEKNKALVLEAFDTLFNKRDYAAAERYWSPHYIQHSAHIAPGREGLFNLIKGLPPTLKYAWRNKGTTPVTMLFFLNGVKSDAGRLQK